MTDLHAEASANTPLSPANETVNARVSIVVLTFNRRDEVLHTLGKLVALSERLPIVVVDNASSDGSCEAIKRNFPQIAIISLPKNFGASARNHGVAMVRTPYVAFCDDDAWWEPGSISRAADILDQHASVALVCARVLVGRTAHEDPTSTCMANSPLQSSDLPGRTILGFMAGASVMRVAAYRQVGGYCPRLFLGGEEELIALDFAARGWRMLYDAAMTVCHIPSAARDAEARRALLARNAVWIACMRLPLRELLHRMLALNTLRNARIRTLWRSLAGLPWALSERRLIPKEVERMRQEVEAAAVMPRDPGLPAIHTINT